MIQQLIIGIFIGILIVSDPFLVANLQSKTLLGVGVPFEISIITLISFVTGGILLFLIQQTKKADVRRAFIILTVIGLQTDALSPLPIALGDLVIGVYFSIFIVICMVKKSELKITIIDILNLSFLLFIMLAISSGYITSSLAAVKFIKLMMLSFLIVNLCTDREGLIFLIKWLIIITTISAFIGILQEAVYVFTGFPVVGFIDAKNMKHMKEITDFGPALKVPGFTGSYIVIAFLLSTNIIITLNILLYIPLTALKKISLWVILLIMSVGLYLTFSRVTLMALGVIVPLVIIGRLQKYLLHISALFLLLLVVVSITINFKPIIHVTDIYRKVQDAVLQERSWGELRIRLQLNREGLYGFINRHPLVGIGAGKSNRYCSHFYGWGAHNALIRVAGDLGIIGLIVYLCIILYSLGRIIVINIKVRDPMDIGVARGLLFAFSLYLILLQFDSVYQGVYLWFLIGVIAAMDSILLRTTSKVKNSFVGWRKLDVL